MHDIYPEHLQEMEEFKAVSKATDVQIEKIKNRLDEMQDDLLITTAQESGIAYREKILGIVPLDTDTLEERRYKVLLYWYDTYPYTEIDLRRRLDRICGPDQYALTIDKVNNTLECLVELTSRKMLNDVRKLLEGIVSLNVAMEVGLRYNQNNKFEQYTYGQLVVYTHGQLREEILT